MSIFRRRVPIVPRIVGRSPADYAQELQEFLKALLDGGEGLPAGFEDVDPTEIQAGTTADPGDPSDGWMAASAIISIETAPPSNATGSVASEGTGTALMRADATVKQGIVTTKGDLLSYSTVPVRVAVGSDGQVLVADSASTPGVKWGAGTPAFPLLAPDGSQSAPSYSFTNKSTSGMYIDSTGIGSLFLNGAGPTGTDLDGGDVYVDGGRGTGSGAAGRIRLRIAPASLVSGTTQNTLQNALFINSTGIVRLGLLNVGFAPGVMEIQATSRAAGVTDGSGGQLEIYGGFGTGTAAGGDVRLYVSPPAASTASTQNSGQRIFTGSGATGDITIEGALPGGGTRGRVLVPSTTWLQQAISRKILTSNYTNATATFSNTALSIDVVTGRKYIFELVLICAESVAAEGIQIDFNGGSAAATNFIASGDVSDSVAAGAIQEVTTLAGTISLATITGASRVTVKGSFEPSSSGTFIIRAAQNTHATGTLTIKRGSWLLMEDVA